MGGTVDRPDFTCAATPFEETRTLTIPLGREYQLYESGAHLLSRNRADHPQKIFGHAISWSVERLRRRLRVGISAGRV